MLSSSPPGAERSVRRARPLLGTRVDIRVAGLDAPAAHAAVDAAFAAIADVHRLMSFHETGSDLSALHREASRTAVTVHRHTASVLRLALALSRESDGRFDISIGHRLVQSGLLPAPAGAATPDPAADWHDIELLDGDRVRFRRPLWIDLGGIAKGYAVDCAIEVLRDAGATQACVNAGGDLRVIGPQPESVAIRLDAGDASGTAPHIELENAALASSCGHTLRRSCAGTPAGPHLRGAHGAHIDTDLTAVVVAPRAMVADALTKIVLADADAAGPVLRAHGAQAWRHHPREGWHALAQTTAATPLN
ncbi:MAG: FAD:protein FMN transferase [Nevskiaceae bacterium]|nr:MAG: FAD:protein FMN transferase [Nevskiaceae bacterium]